MSYSKKLKKPVGFLVDYIEKILGPAMKLKIKWYGPMTLARYFVEVKKNKFDMGFLLADVQGMRQLFELSHTPHYSGKQIVTTKKKFLSSKNDKKTLLYFSIAKSMVIPFFKKQDQVNFQFIYGVDWIRRSLKMIDNNRAHGVYTPETLAISYHLAKLKNKDQFICVTLPLKDVNFFAGFNLLSKKIKSLSTSYNLLSIKIKTGYRDYALARLRKDNIKLIQCNATYSDFTRF